MKRLRKWYAKRKMKQYLLDTWIDDYHEALNAHENDPENTFYTKEWVEDGESMIKQIEALRTYEEIRDAFSDMISGIHSRGYQAVDYTVRILVER